MGFPTQTKKLSIVEVTRDREGAWSYLDLNRLFCGLPGPQGPIPFVAEESALAGVGLGSDGQRLYYLDAFGGVIELVYDGKWTESQRLTSDFGAPAAGSGRLAATSGGGLLVYYLDAGCHVVRLQWDRDGTWSHRIASAAPASSPASALSALATEESYCVYYLSGRHLIEVRWDAELNESFLDLTSRIKGADEPGIAPYALSSLAADGFGTDHRRVYYPGQSGDLVELALDGKAHHDWEALDLTAGSGAPVAATPTPLATFTIEDGRPQDPRARLFYLDESRDISSMSWEGTGWAPTVLAHDPAASRQSALAGASDPQSSLELATYLDEFGHLLTLIRAGDGWDRVDLSAELNLPRAFGQSPLNAVVTGDGAHIHYLTDEPSA